MSGEVVSAFQGRSRLDTAFTEALRQVVARVPGARGAVFLDGEGEAVDEFAEVSTTEIRILGAHLGILIAIIKEHAGKLGDPQELVIETERAILLVLVLDDRYMVALEAGPTAQLGVMRRELGRAADALRREM
ncbi:MAG: roadblock/LC7 domain-containing protein [Polyangia bacterium]